MTQNIFLPIFIIIISFLVIYAIINNRKANTLNKNIENFISDIKENNDLLRNTENFPLVTSSFANGKWTTPWTYCNRNIHSPYYCHCYNYMTINITENAQNVGTKKNHVYGNITIKSEEYNIIYMLNKNMVCVDPNNINKNVHIVFNNIYTNKNPTDKYSTVKYCIVTQLIKNSIINKWQSFWFETICQDHFLYNIVKDSSTTAIENDPAEVYDLTTYNKIVGDYKYPSNYLTVDYGISNKDILDKINSKYNEGIKFAIQRVFKSPTGNEIITKISDPIVIEGTRYGTIPNNIIISSFTEDKDINNLKNYFKPLSTILYFYKLQVIDVTYDYSDKQLVTVGSSAFNLNNNATNMYQPNVQYNNLNTVEQLNNSQYQITLLGRYPFNNISDPLKIPFTQFYDIL
jgi:hypothetical protein